MKYVLVSLLLFFGLFAQTEDSDKGNAFFSLDFGVAVDSKFADIHHPMAIMYGGNISQNVYAGTFAAGIGGYGGPFNLAFRYGYDFINFNPDWGFGVDLSLYLGGSKEYNYGDVGKTDEWIALYVGGDLGLFLRRHISRTFAVFVRGGVNKALVHELRPSKTVVRKFEDANGYLGTGIQWYF